MNKSLAFVEREKEIEQLHSLRAVTLFVPFKADLFSAADREQMINYVTTNLRSQLHVEAPVHAVSVFGADAALCDRWFESELRPFLAQHITNSPSSRKSARLARCARQ